MRREAPAAPLHSRRWRRRIKRRRKPESPLSIYFESEKDPGVLLVVPLSEAVRAPLSHSLDSLMFAPRSPTDGPHEHRPHETESEMQSQRETARPLTTHLDRRHVRPCRCRSANATGENGEEDSRRIQELPRTGEAPRSLRRLTNATAKTSLKKEVQQ